MAKINSILTVDIGGDNLKVAEFVYPVEGGMVLTGFKFLAYDAELKESNFNEAFKIAFNEAIGAFTSRRCRITISGQNSFSRLSKLPPLGNDKKGLNQIVNFEARQTVPYPIEEVVWDYQLIHHEVEVEVQSEVVPEDDGDENSAVPEKTKVKKEEIEALFVAVKKDLITDLTNVVQQAGVEVLSVEIAPVATFNALRGNQIGLEQCDLVLNIGGRSSSLIIADGNCLFIRSIPIAGQTITQQIAKEFNISLTDAEDMKIRHGFVALGGAYEEADSEVASMVSKIARNVMTRLHGEVNRSINVWRSQHGGNKPKRLFLCGGGS
ncbi:MAG: pilus assembly protein PilM, partial [Victivallaceae bacterium]